MTKSLHRGTRTSSAGILPACIAGVTPAGPLASTPAPRKAKSKEKDGGRNAPVKGAGS